MMSDKVVTLPENLLKILSSLRQPETDFRSAVSTCEMLCNILQTDYRHCAVYKRLYYDDDDCRADRETMMARAAVKDDKVNLVSGGP